LRRERRQRHGIRHDQRRKPHQHSHGVDYFKHDDTVVYHDTVYHDTLVNHDTLVDHDTSVYHDTFVHPNTVVVIAASQRFAEQ